MKNETFTELKSIYDFLEIRKKIYHENPEGLDKNEIHNIINMQKVLYLELSDRINNID